MQYACIWIYFGEIDSPKLLHIYTRLCVCVCVRVGNTYRRPGVKHKQASEHIGNTSLLLHVVSISIYFFFSLFFSSFSFRFVCFSYDWLWGLWTLLCQSHRFEISTSENICATVDGIRRHRNGEWRYAWRALCRSRVHVVTSARSAPRLVLLLLPLSILLQFASHEYSSSYFHFLFPFSWGLGLHFLLQHLEYAQFFLFHSFSLSLSFCLSVSAKHLCRWQTARSVVCFSFIRWESLTTGMAKDDQIKLCVSVRFECSELLRGY